MIGDPKVVVTCDECGMEEEHGLTVTAKGWDDRGLVESLRRQGWEVTEDGNKTVCAECVEERREEERKQEWAEAEAEAEAERVRERNEWQRDGVAWGPGEGYGYA